MGADYAHVIHLNVIHLNVIHLNVIHLPMLSIYLLGALRLLDGGAPLKFTTLPKTPHLLAYLLLAESSPISRATLAALLWPDLPAAESRGNLRRHLHDLRRGLPPDSPGRPWLLIDSHRLAWNRDADYWLDTDTFRAAAQDPARQAEAIALYTGDLLESLYEDWIFFMREQLRATFFDLLLAQLRRQHQAGDLLVAQATAQRILHHDPLREDVLRELMTLRFEAGDRAGALAEYQRFEHRLRGEMQLAPMPETQAHYDRIARQGLIAQTAAVQPIPAALPAAGAADAARTNLPAPVTTFIGRDAELDTLHQLLVSPGSDLRLLTLIGPGGSGKSRLALEFGARVYANASQAFPDGIFAVFLSPVTAPDQAPRALASVFNLGEQYGQSSIQTLKSFLAPKKLLLILDNFEHLLPAAGLLTELLGAAPNLRMIVTSRTLLHVYGEHKFTVQPLPLPDGAARQPLDELARVASVALFVARSRAVNPQFVLNSDNAAAVAEICIRLDGLPLAIELAAARAKLLPPAAMVTRIGNRLELLTDRTRLQEEHHQTLRATLDWSYHLLNASEQRVFGLLAIFPAGFSLDAAETVTRECMGRDALNEIESLLDNSLLVRDDGDDVVRLRMLATVREYAREHLRRQGNWGRAAASHAHYILEWVEKIQLQLFGPNQARALTTLEMDHPNLRAVLAYAAAQQPILGLQLATLLQRYWLWSSHRAEGLEWLERLLTLPDAQTDAVIYLQARISAAHLAYYTSDAYHDAVQSTCEQCLKQARALGRQALVADILRRLGDVLAYSDLARAFACLEESLALAMHLGEGRAEANARISLAILHVIRGDVPRARQLFDTSTAYFTRIGDTWSVSFCAIAFAQALHRARADDDAAYKLYEQSIRLAGQSGDRMYYAFALANMADIAMTRQDYAKVESLAREALDLFRNLGEMYQGPRLVRYLGLVAETRGNLVSASAAFHESFDLNQRLNDRRGMAAALVAMARIAWRRGHAAIAVEILAGVEHLLLQLRLPLLPADQTVFDQVWTAACAGLRDSEIDAARAAGRGQDLTALMAVAERGLSSPI